MDTNATEWEATLRPVVQRFEKFFLGRSSRQTDIIRCNGLVIIRSQGALTDAESRLLQADPTPAGREMVEQMYRKMVRQAQESLTGAVESSLGVTVRSLFCDINASSGESIIVMSCE